MKHLKLVFIIGLCVISTLLGKAQERTETKDHQLIASKLETFYNNENYDAIFELFDEIFKSYLPLEQTRSFFGNLKLQVGNINEKEFKRFVRGSFASYKTTFDGGVLALNISINENAKINGLFVEPYKDVKSIPVAENNKAQLILPFKEKWKVFGVVIP